MKKYKIVPVTGAVRHIQAASMQVSNGGGLIYLLDEEGGNIAVIQVAAVTFVAEDAKTE